MATLSSYKAPIEIDDPFFTSSSRIPLSTPSFFANISTFPTGRQSKAARPSSMSIFPSVLQPLPRALTTASSPAAASFSGTPRSVGPPQSSSGSSQSSTPSGYLIASPTSPRGPCPPYYTSAAPSSLNDDVTPDAEMKDAFATPRQVLTRPNYLTSDIRQASSSSSDQPMSSPALFSGLPSPPSSGPPLSKKHYLPPTNSLMVKPKIQTGARLSVSYSTTPLTPPLTPLVLVSPHHLQSPSSVNSAPAARPSAISTGPPPTLSARALRDYPLHPLFSSAYTIQEELGAGGFGFVVRASRNSDSLSVAVKFIERQKVQAHGWVKSRSWGDAPGLFPQQGDHRVVPMEAFVLRTIRHQGVVAYIDSFEDEKYFYLVMEHHGSPWVSSDKADAPKTSPSDMPALAASASSAARSPPTPESSPIMTSSVLPPSPKKLAPPRPAPMERRSSCDLFECIEQHNRFDEQTSKYVFAQIIEIVFALSTMGIVHRDIKDENIVIANDFRVKLIDFGSAVIFDPRKPAPIYNRFFGTTSFASAEILRGDPYNPFSAEIWSLGVLLSILVTGECPFADAEAAKQGRLSKPKVRLGLEVEHLLKSCLEVDVSKRITIDGIRRHPWLARRSRTAV